MENNFGRRLLPSILHQQAQINPQRNFALVAKSNNIDDGFNILTFEQLARAVNYTANWLQSQFEDGRKPALFETIAYIGNVDVRYNILFYAAAQCRYKIFLPSPRNPSATNISLLEQTNCSRLVYSAEVAPVAKALQVEALKVHLKSEQLPSLDELLAVPQSSYLYELDFTDVAQDPVLILHSSGSTGSPKPVTSTHGTLATYDIRDWPTVPGRRNHDGLSTLRFPEANSRIYDAFPPFHIAGFMTKIMAPLYNLTIPIFGPSVRPPSGDLTAQVIRLQRPRGLVLPPSIVEQLFHGTGGEDIFEQLDVVLFAGGPLSSVVGSKISKKTRLCQFYGSTEIGQIRQLMPHPDDWGYLEFHPHESFELQPSDNADLCELVLFSGPHLERTSSLYHNYPDLKEWRTKDLFVPHPTKSKLWKFHARTDDVLVFSSGEKLNPIPIESALTGVPGVSGALVTGQKFPQAALLIELGSDAAFTDPINELWPTIQAANTLLPGHGRIAKSMVVIASSHKPFSRAGKGTVIRRLTEDLYADEIRELYKLKLTKTSIVPRPSLFGIEDVRLLIHSVVDQVFNGTQIGDDDNLYINGMDSIKTAEALNNLKGSLLTYNSKSELSWLSLETFYLNPTINQLSLVLMEFLNYQKMPEARNRVEEMKAKIRKYSSLLLGPPPADTLVKDINAPRFGVAITGTTGYFGGVLLTELVANPHVQRIYCLNRSPSAAKKFEKLGPSHEKQVTFLRVQFDSPDLGLDEQMLTQVVKDCNVIIHNAWKVDYNLSLDSLEDNLRGLVNLIALSSRKCSPLHFVFISSITSTGVWTRKNSPPQTIPEDIVGIEQLDTTLDIGYAESKRVAEHILDEATRKFHLPVTILRMGQLVPSCEHVKWPENDILTVLLQTSKSSHLLPTDFLDVVNWVSVDQGAAVVGEVVREVLTSGQEALGPRVFNVVDPNERPWREFLVVIEAWCGLDVKRVTLRQWVEHLRLLRTDDTDLLGELPALRMLRMFELMADRGPMHKYAMENLMVTSPTMSKLGATDEKAMALWLCEL